MALCSWLAALAALRSVALWCCAVATARLCPAERCRCRLPTAALRASVVLRLFAQARLRLERAARSLLPAACLHWALAVP